MSQPCILYNPTLILVGNVNFRPKIKMSLMIACVKIVFPAKVTVELNSKVSFAVLFLSTILEFNPYVDGKCRDELSGGKVFK